MIYSLAQIETQLKKRLPYPYKWYRKQNDVWDGYTQFIYQIEDWDLLITKIAQTVKEKQIDKRELFYYAVNRWYNFRSAQAIESIFTNLQDVKPVPDKKDKEKDFLLRGIPFDHKTTVFPKGFKKSFAYAKQHKNELIHWLYKNQSTQQRYHTKNRLFIVVYNKNGNHWKLKCELTLLKEAIQKYVSTFNPNQLHEFNFTPNTKTYSDIIWVEKEC